MHAYILTHIHIYASGDIQHPLCIMHTYLHTYMHQGINNTHCEATHAIHECMYTYAYIYTYTHTYKSRDIQAPDDEVYMKFMHTFTYMHTYTHVYIHKYIRGYITPNDEDYIQLYIYTHAYIHTSGDT